MAYCEITSDPNRPDKYALQDLDGEQIRMVYKALGSMHDYRAIHIQEAIRKEIPSISIVRV